MVEKGQKISRIMSEDIQNAGINSVEILIEDKVLKGNRKSFCRYT